MFELSGDEEAVRMNESHSSSLLAYGDSDSEPEIPSSFLAPFMSLISNRVSPTLTVVDPVRGFLRDLEKGCARTLRQYFFPLQVGKAKCIVCLTFRTNVQGLGLPGIRNQRV